MQQIKSSRKQIVLSGYCLVTSILACLLPHPTNFSPLVTFCLFTGRELPKRLAIAVMLIAVTLADVLLAVIKGYPAYGWWMVFSLSGYITIILSGSLCKKCSFNPLLAHTITASFGYWVWTNFGAWLTSPIYSKNLIGLGSCFAAGLPFLPGAIIGSGAWAIVTFVSYRKLVAGYSIAESS